MKCNKTAVMKPCLFLIVIGLSFSVGSAQVVDPNIAQYGLGRTHGYLQTDSTTVTPYSFSFRAFVDATAGGVINKARISGPPIGSFYGVSGPQDLNVYSGGAEIEYTSTLADASLSDFPNLPAGNFTLKIDDGVLGGPISPGGYDYSAQLAIGVDAYVADIPTFSIDNGSWSGGSFAVDVTNPTTFSWSFPTFDSSTDMVFFSITAQNGDEVVKMQFPQGTNPGSFLLNAGMLTFGESYVGQLTFAHIVDISTDIPGVFGFAYYATETTVLLQSVPEPSTYALLVLGLGVVLLQVRRRRQ